MLAAHVPGDATSDIAVAAKRFGRRKNERAPISVRFGDGAPFSPSSLSIHSRSFPIRVRSCLFVVQRNRSKRWLP